MTGVPAASSAARAEPGDWLLEVPGAADGPVLVLFPHAGAGASAYLRLAQSLRQVSRPLIVRLPGRETRLAEPPLTDLRQVVRRLAPVLQDRVGTDFVLYGHSMGALIAFETARLFSLGYGMHPRRLVVSGMEAPQEPVPVRKRHLRSDDELWELIAEMGGLPPEIADDPAMRQMILPALRADFQITDEYALRVVPRLSCPISAFAGAKDAELAPETMLGWQEHTHGGFRHAVFDGAHFFNLDESTGFAAALRDAVTG